MGNQILMKAGGMPAFVMKYFLRLGSDRKYRFPITHPNQPIYRTHTVQ
jgi:hypothetical protein